MTSLVHRIFMDMDSILSSSHHTPTDMFKSLPCCCVQGCPAESVRQQTPSALALQSMRWIWPWQQLHQFGSASVARSGGALFVLRKWCESLFNGWNANRGEGWSTCQSGIDYCTRRGQPRSKVNEAVLIGPTISITEKPDHILNVLTG